MTRYTIENGANFFRRVEKVEKQNKAELLDVKDGCLIDNYLYRTKRGYMILSETYQNCWTSKYTLIFSTDEKEINEQWNNIK